MTADESARTSTYSSTNSGTYYSVTGNLTNHGTQSSTAGSTDGSTFLKIVTTCHDHTGAQSDGQNLNTLHNLSFFYG
jgi:hypothetical protein